MWMEPSRQWPPMPLHSRRPFVLVKAGRRPPPLPILVSSTLMFDQWNSSPHTRSCNERAATNFCRQIEAGCKNLHY